MLLPSILDGCQRVAQGNKVTVLIISGDVRIPSFHVMEQPAVILIRRFIIFLERILLQQVLLRQALVYSMSLLHLLPSQLIFKTQLSIIIIVATMVLAILHIIICGMLRIRQRIMLPQRQRKPSTIRVLLGSVCRQVIFGTILVAMQTRQVQTAVVIQTGILLTKERLGR